MTRFVTLNCILLFLTTASVAQSKSDKNDIAVIAYFFGRATQVDSFAVEKLTHIIYSFCHLSGNKLVVDRVGDTATIKNLVALKARNPELKVMLSLGGWGGCKTCPDVFSTKAGRKEFAESVKDLAQHYGTDGIDLDWEYPALSGFPGHPYSAADRPNFTSLVKVLRKTLGKNQIISFATGGTTAAIDSCYEWKKVMRKANFVNLMSYDLTSGFSTSSGHHTPLYSNDKQAESTDNGVQRLLAAGVPANQIVIGAAFYARLFEVEDTLNNGLYRPAKFYRGVPYNRFKDSLTVANGFTDYWDEVSNAPYSFNPERKLFATYDNPKSLQIKTNYAIKNKLMGLMFWQLTEDVYSNGLLHTIDETKKTSLQ